MIRIIGHDSLATIPTHWDLYLEASSALLGSVDEDNVDDYGLGIGPDLLFELVEAPLQISHGVFSQRALAASEDWFSSAYFITARYAAIELCQIAFSSFPVRKR
jgi:hypothetical protein